MTTMTRAYSITAERLAAETAASGGDPSAVDVSKVVAVDDLELRDLGPTDVQMKILAVSAEHNIDHAATADTINIAEARGGKIYPGNSALGEVTAVGRDVTKFVAGDIVVTHCNGEPDENGFPLRIWAYDQPESIGWYAKDAVVEEWQLIKAPLDCGLNLWEMAALPLRAPTAYHLWRRAIGIYRVKVPYERKARLNVLSFGGGVGELFLMLAKAEGHNAYFCAGSKERRDALEKQGIVGIDQKQFNRFATRDDIKAFSKEVKGLTDGEGMHLVCDMLRGPVFEAGLAVAGRCGVNVSAGWQLSQVVSYNSTVQSVKQVTIDHTHYETPIGCEAATELYGSVFKPTIHDEVYSFDDMPRCFQEMHENTQTGIPIIRVADELPDSVAHLV
ncbi:alcohol dehydrogenase catalytic domain-containing protein [Actinospongicola halichondriae]|uniref:alcohol dehydrogenase catalytic domain-containing protein n=1 Tax=Actinospongicola halichondriae TaxID=3236844 RepID=UPI003D47A6D5